MRGTAAFRGGCARPAQAEEAEREVLRAVRLRGEQPLYGARRALWVSLPSSAGIYKCIARNAKAVAVKKL